MPTDGQKLEVLKARAAAIQRTKDYTDSPQFARATALDITIRLTRMDEQWDSLHEMHTALIGVVGIDQEQLTTDVATSEEVYYSVYAKMKAKYDELKAIDRAAVVAPVVQVQMPFQQHDIRNTWGEFDGSLTKWQGFRDRFVAAIHDNNQIAPSYKFSYLKNSLVGKAARTLGEWQLTDRNYVEAWDRLNHIYDRKYHICRAYLRQLERLPVLEAPVRANELQRMSNVTYETLRQLGALGVPVHFWDVMIVHMLHERLDQETGRQWELHRDGEFPPISDMLAFIDKQAASINVPVNQRFKRPVDLTVSIPNEQTSDKDRGKTGNGKNESGKKENPRKRSASSSPAVQRKRLPCEACQGDHPIWECPEFIALRPSAREDFVQKRSLCPNCLKRGHGKDDCYLGPCIRCPNRPRHNSLLCPLKQKESGKSTFTVQSEVKRVDRQTKEKRD